MCYMMLLAYFSPWRYKVADSLDMAVHLSIVALMAISTLFYDHTEKDIQQNDAVGVFATVMSCCPFILFPCFFIALVRLPFEQKYLPTRYHRRMTSMLKTIHDACESLSHLKPEDVTCLLKNLEENDRRTLHACCSALSAELHNTAQNRLSNGLSLSLGQSVSDRKKSILDVPLRLPHQFSSSLGTWQSSIDVVSLFSPSCGGIGGFTKTFVMRSLIPIIFGIATVGTFVLSHLLSRCAGRKKQFAMEFDRTVNLYFSVLFAFFIGIAAASLSLFKCQDNPSKERTLTQDLSVICGGSEWNSVLVVAILCILVYCIGCGAIYVGVIIVAPRRFSTMSFQKRWKFLFIKYNSTVYWWSTVILAKGVVLALSSVVVRDPLGQLYWLMFTCKIGRSPPTNLERELQDWVESFAASMKD
jgi:hypothetical protein